MSINDTQKILPSKCFFVNVTDNHISVINKLSFVFLWQTGQLKVFKVTFVFISIVKN